MKKTLEFAMLIQVCFCLLPWFAFPGCVQKSDNYLHVADFGAIPDDGIDDAPAIRKALDFAKESKAKGLRFSKGRYDIMTIVDGDTLRKIGFEEEYPQTTKPNENVTGGLFFIGIKDLDNFTFEGEVDKMGDPATWLVRANPVKNNYYSPSLLFISNCSDLVIQNIGFDNDAYFYSAGVIVEINKEAKIPYVVVDILTEHPRKPDMGSFTMGCYDMENKKLLAGRLTWNSIGMWQPVEGGNGRLMKLESSKWFNPDPYFRYMSADGLLGEPLDEHLPTLSVGQALYWHQANHNAKQVFATGCTNLSYINVHTRNASGFGFDTRLTRNLKLFKVVAAPGHGRIMAGQRDAFKINSCTGNVTIDSCHFEGFSDDALNIHGKWFKIKNISEDRLTVSFFPGANLPDVNSVIGFFDHVNIEEIIRVVKFSEVNRENGLIIVGLDQALPSNVDTTMQMVNYSHLPESLHLTNTVIKNIKGSGVILKTSNATIENCRFENIMNMGVQIGSEQKSMEAGIPNNVIIRNNVFDNCGGFINRKENPIVGGWFFGDPAVISLDVDKLDVPGAIFNVHISRNIFRNLPVDGIYLRDAANITITGNKFESLTGNNVTVDKKTTRQILIED